MKFLTARWSNLFLATYVVPPELLRPHLPPGLELDTRDGHSFASLVGFEFLDTRVLGIPWPGFRNFPEWNLRFYVRHGERRGVVFVREFVPQRFVAWAARTLYKEPYQAAQMANSFKHENATMSAEYRIEQNGKTHVMHVTAEKPAVRPGPESVEHFFKEHEWGFGTTRRGETMVYRVEHPVWDVYPVRESKIEVDWAMLYGAKWAAMQGAVPYSTVLAVGSDVAVYTGKPLG